MFLRPERSRGLNVGLNQTCLYKSAPGLQEDFKFTSKIFHNINNISIKLKIETFSALLYFCRIYKKKYTIHRPSYTHTYQYILVNRFFRFRFFFSYIHNVGIFHVIFQTAQVREFVWFYHFFEAHSLVKGYY